MPAHFNRMVRKHKLIATTSHICRIRNSVRYRLIKYHSVFLCLPTASISMLGSRVKGNCTNCSTVFSFRTLKCINICHCMYLCTPKEKYTYASSWRSLVTSSVALDITLHKRLTKGFAPFKMKKTRRIDLIFPCGSWIFQKGQ